MSWRSKTIGEICSLITSGGTPTSTNESYYYPPEIPWLKTGEVNYSRIYNTEKHISREGLANSSAKLIPANSVIIAMYGQGNTAGRVAINKVPITTNQACCNLVINSGIANYEFVYYTLCTMYDKIVSLKNGGAQPNLNAKTIKSLKIRLPNLPTQRYIASILSAYDDLIENNQKQIKLLEEAAQRLYKEWFVDLRFPGWENTKIVDGVPEGWEKTTISSVSSVLRRGISPKYNDNAAFTGINQKCIRQTIVDFSESRKQEKTFSSEMALIDGDTVICSTGAGTLGRVGQIFGSPTNATFDSHVTLVRTNGRIGAQLLFQSLKDQQTYLQDSGKGSTNQLELSRTTIAECPVFIPSEPVSKHFEVLVLPIHDLISKISQSILSLQNSKDMMLSKLMNENTEEHHAS